MTVQNLFFSYNEKPFIENINFHVERGEILGFLGPSGAGKSTLQKILIGLLPGYQGQVKVSQVDVAQKTNHFYEHIGVDFEFPCFYEKMTARKNLEFFSSLYQSKPSDLTELFRLVHLESEMDKKVASYSKGMKSRLNFIKALVHDPDILFLDEPTSGLDPSNRYDMLQAIHALKEQGKTIIITTHDMQDATDLCDRVAFIVGGKIKALDSPHNLIMRKGAATLTYTYLENDIEQIGSCLISESANDTTLMQLIKTNRVRSIHSSEPTLNDIFIELTGRRLQ